MASEAVDHGMQQIPAPRRICNNPVNRGQRSRQGVGTTDPQAIRVQVRRCHQTQPGAAPMADHAAVASARFDPCVTGLRPHGFSR